MMMTQHERDDLEDLFAAARAGPPAVPPRLLARIQADALAQRPSAPVRLGDLWRGLGGWWGLGGLATAGCTGLWIGVMPPATLPDPLVLLSDAGLDWIEEDAGDAVFGWHYEEGSG